MILPLVSGGCATPIAAPVTDLRPFKPITLSCADTASTRKQIVAHNSVLDSLKRNKRVIYSDDCPEGKPTS